MKKLVLVVFLIPLLSCSTKELSPLDFIKWVESEDNGLIYKKRIGGLIYELQYKPVDYVALKELNKEVVNNQELENVKKNYDELDHFNLKISRVEGGTEVLRHDISSESEYQQRIHYFSFEAQKDFFLIGGGDTISCALYHFERSYDLAPFCNIVLGFPKLKNEGSDMIISFLDRGFGTGIINMQIQLKDINNIPIVARNEKEVF